MKGAAGSLPVVTTTEQVRELVLVHRANGARDLRIVRTDHDGRAYLLGRLRAGAASMTLAELAGEAVKVRAREVL